jgi:hypothetical protein
MPRGKENGQTNKHVLAVHIIKYKVFLIVEYNKMAIAAVPEI